MINLTFIAIEELENLRREGYEINSLHESRCLQFKNPEGETFLEVFEQEYDKLLILRADPEFTYGKEIQGIKKYCREDEEVMVLFYLDCAGKERSKVVEVKKY